MKRKRLIHLVLVILLTTSLFQNTSFSRVSNEETQYQKWYVDQQNEAGPWDGSSQHPFACITDAITLAEPYDRIYVQNGTYFEHIFLDFPISLIGLSSPTIDGLYNKTVITAGSNDVYISGFIIQHSGGYSKDSGIFASSAYNISIQDCIIHHTKNGISINQSTVISIEHCFFTHNGNGIFSQDANDLDITRCDFSHNAISIVGIKNYDFLLLNSTFYGNGICGMFYEGQSYQIMNCNLSDNSVNKGGFIFSNVSDASISDCLFYHNGDGISISNSDRLLISDCSFLNNTHFAISMRSASKNVVISSCILSDGLRSALYIEPGNRCTIQRSHLTSNYLYSISAEPLAMYSAKNNWWGTSLGPFEPSMSLSNKIKGLQWLTHCIPWAKEPFQYIGVSMDQIPKPTFDQMPGETPLLPIEGTDSDGDGAPDWWENKWGYDPAVPEDHGSLDPDGDALTNLQECYVDTYGSNPFKKDVFLEIDWMECPDLGNNRPDGMLLQTVIDSFAEHDISLHIDIGDLGGGEPIPNHCDHSVMYHTLEDLYWTYFLHNDMTNPRKGIFHYGVICNYCPDLNFPFMGWDSFDGFAVSAQWLEDKYPRYDREQIIVGGLVHHLGHTLGLIADVFKGIDNVDVIRPFTLQWFAHNDYKSSMNYLYKFTIFTYSDGVNGQGDFNDWAALRYDFFKYSDFTSLSKR
jgi:parallel beta-helix repeat protein